jgi:glycosyltransferase involved in cell wall biosynthesis
MTLRRNGVNKRPFFSLIIPCYNTGEKIRRVLDSLTRQGIDKDDLEIIIVDDNSTDKSFIEIAKTYDFNIIFTETHTTVHCPGNTRRQGMNCYTGKWLFFCDHDDYFEDHALPQVRDYILNCNHEPMLVCTILHSYNEKTQTYTLKLARHVAWLHGKFYNVDKLIRPYYVNFKENLITHEDIYFNSLVLSHLYDMGMTYDYLDIPTYRWVEDETSITRSYHLHNTRPYMYDNFNDYIIAAGDPYWDKAIRDGNPFYINQLMMILLHSYFYYEAASYYNGPTEYKDVLNYIRNFLLRLLEDLDITLDSIVDYIYSDPLRFKQVQEECEISTNIFIPKTSFRDFVYRLGGKQ